MREVRMHRGIGVSIAAAGVVAGLLIPGERAEAVGYSWDGDSATAGAQAGSGVWDLTTTNWIAQSDVSLTPTTWVNNNEAFFGGVDATAGSPYYIDVADSNKTDNLGTIMVSASGPVPINILASGYVLRGTAPTGLEPGGTVLDARTISVTAGKSATVSNLRLVPSAPGSGGILNNAISALTSSKLTFASGSTYEMDPASGTPNLSIHGGIDVHFDSGASAVVKNNITLGGQNTAGLAASLIVDGGSINMKGGALTLGSSSNSIGIVTVNGGTLNLSNTATAANGILRIGNSSIVTDSLAQTGVVSLNGGTFITKQIVRGHASNPITSTINLNGGLLQVQATADVNRRNAFLTGLTSAYVQVGGAKIDTNRAVITDTVTIGQALLHDPALGATLDGGLVKLGGGVLMLNGANTYTGLTDIQSGAIVLGGSAVNTVTGGVHVAAGAGFLPGTSYTVGSGKTLSGGGLITTASVTPSALIVDASGAIVAPGDSPGVLTIQGELTLSDLSTLDFEFNGAPGGANDMIALTGAEDRDLILDGTLNITNLGGMTTGQYTLISGATSISDLGLVVGTAPGSFEYDVTTDASNVYLVVSIPEPASLALLGLGVTMLARRRRV